MASLEELAPVLGVRAACEAMGVPRDTLVRERHRRHRQCLVGPPVPRRPRPRPPLALDDRENALIVDTLNSDRFVDVAPAAAHAMLLDEGVYLGSLRTFHRRLAALGSAGDRRAQRKHCHYAKPELLATAPNQVWSWDITKLKGPAKWTYFHLYVILDIFSRDVVGWMIAERETAALAEQLIEQTLARQGIARDTLTLHADRGSSMRSKPVADLLVDLGVTRSHSRPHVSDDNPYSESQFKTMKYRPDFPARFGCIEDARAHCRAFFDWYSFEHRHSGIGYMTPHAMHNGQADAIHAIRQDALDQAFLANPLRFKGRQPTPPKLPTAAWINPPSTRENAANQTTQLCPVNS